jgi:integrase
VTVRKSKTDQEGQSVTIAITRGSAACPVDAVRVWISESNISDGPLFRAVARTGKVYPRRLSARAVAELVKAYARRAGLKAANFSGHSLRSGFLTSAAGRGASIFKMMDVSRHKSIDTLRGYVMPRYFVIMQVMDYCSLFASGAVHEDHYNSSALG